MVNSSDQAVDQQGAIDDVLAEYLQRVDEGEAIDRDEFIAAHPDVADALKSYFAGADEVDRVAGPTVAETMGTAADENDTAVASESQPAPTRADGAIPREFGRYRVVRTLGTGAMGAVYLADDTQLDRQVALKVPKFAKKERSELLLRFNREAKAAATLSHPNVCPVFDVGEIDGTHFISMGYVEGRPLDELIGPERSLSETQVASVIRKLALALAEAHQKGVVHRDIKPANIMIDKRREPIIMDFGLARSLAATEEERVTHDGAIVGTPAYMPPEQIKGEIAEVGPAADIYSLGVVMYEMLTGRLPYSGSVTEVIARVLHDPVPSPAELRPEMDGRLNAICMKAMSKAAADRYASMNELAAELTKYLQKPAEAASPQEQTGKTSMATTPQQPSSKAVKNPSAGEFDPYHKWLGISPKEQPPNHYRLLAIELFESDADAIQAAAIARSTYVRQCASGPHAAVSQEVLNELSEAEICLLIPEKKAAYDAQLKAELDAKEAAKPQAAGTATETVSTGKKAKPAADSKLAQQIQKLDKQKKQIESLLDKCEFATAISALEKMAAVKSPKLAKYAKWAKQQIPKAKRGTKEMRESSAAVFRTASELFDRNDYEEAAEMLQQIPKKYRDAEFSELLQECLDRQEEIVVLQEDIDHAESLNKYQDLQPTVERLLELKPNDRRARKLLKELKTYGKGGGMRLVGRGDKRFDAAGNTSNPLKVALGILIPVVLFGAVGYATVVYVRSNNKTIKIEIDDPSAKVVIDGETVKITGVGDEITLKVGTHDLVVERDGLVVQTNQFEVVKGKNPVLRISLEDLAVAGAGGEESGKADEEVVYLADLKEVSVNNGPWPFSKGKVGDSQIRWQGVAYPKALSMHPPGNGSRIVKYQLSKRYREFESKVGLTLAKTPAESLVTFSVVGDGKELWKSEPTKQPDPPQSCRVDVSNVDVLELHVNSPGGAAGAHAAWFDPKLIGRMSAPSSLPSPPTVATTGGARGGSVTPNSPTISAAMTLKGHEGFPLCVAFSPDGRQIVSGDNLGTLKLWDAATGQETLSFSARGRSAIQDVAFSPDGRRIVSGDQNRTLKVWDAATGKETQTLSGHKDYVLSIAISPDGNRIVSGSGGQDRTLKVWDAATGQELRTLSGHTKLITSVAYSPDGKLIVSGSGDSTIKLWDASTGQELRTLSGHTPIVYSVAFSPDGKQIASGGHDWKIKLWDAATGKEVRTFSGHKSMVHSVAFSPDSKWLVSSSHDMTLKLWDVATGNEVRTVSGNTGIIKHVAFSPDGTRIVTCSEETIKLWDVSKIISGSGTSSRATNANVPVVVAGKTLQGHLGPVQGVTFSPDGRQVVSSSQTVKIWNEETGQVIRSFGNPKTSYYRIAVSPDGTKIVTANYSKRTLSVWETATGRELQTLSGSEGYVACVAISPDGKKCLSGNWGNSNNIKEWDIVTGREIRTLAGHPDRVNCVAYSPDGQVIASGSQDQSIKLWDAEGGQELRTLAGHGENVFSVVFSPDGRMLISSGQDGAIKLWDVSTGNELRKIQGHSTHAWSAAISPDGKQIVSGGHDNTVKLWDTATGKEIQVFEGHTAPVYGVAFSPDGKQIASVSGDKTVRLWNLSTGGATTTSTGEPGSSSKATNRQIAERILGLGGSIVTDSGAIKTVDELPQQPFEISQIVLSNTQITNDGLADLQGLQSLTVLRLENTSIGDAGLGHLKGLTNLETLLLTGTQVTDAGLVHLQGMTKLVNLYLANTPVAADGLQHIAALESLAELRFGNTKVDDASLVHLKGLTNLNRLFLENTPVGDAGLTHLKGLTNLETLILTGTQVTDAGLANLQGMTKLVHLYLGNTPVSGDGLKHVAAMDGLESLRLTNTQVDNSDLIHVKGLTNLTNIYLDNTPVSDAGLEQLKGLTNLDIIVLTGTQVTDAGLVNLQGMTRLAHLYLGNTAVTGNGLKQLEELTTLLSLRLTNTQVDDSALAHLHKMKKLTDLRVDGTKITENGVADLQQTLPNCRVTR